MEKKVKVVFHLGGEGADDNDRTFGKNGSFFRLLQERSGVEIDFVRFCDNYFGDCHKSDFLRECSDAQVVITDISTISVGSDGWERGKDEMYSIIQEISISNPRARIFTRTVDNEESEIHRYGLAEPIDLVNESCVYKAIKNCVKKEGLPEILVFDDNTIHRESSYEQLSDDYNVITVSTYDRAETLIKEGLVDIVLLDLLVLASRKNMGRDGLRFVGQEMPLTSSLVFLAIDRGIKRIGVLTDTSHHLHPASASLDVFRGRLIRNLGDIRLVFSNSSFDLLSKGEIKVKNWKRLVEKISAV